MVFASIAAATAVATVGGRSLLTGQSRRQADAISGGLIIIKKTPGYFFDDFFFENTEVIHLRVYHKKLGSNMVKLNCFWSISGSKQL